METTIVGYIGIIGYILGTHIIGYMLGLSRAHGKEMQICFSIIGVIVGRVDKKMETSILNLILDVGNN